MIFQDYSIIGLMVAVYVFGFLSRFLFWDE